MRGERRGSPRGSAGRAGRRRRARGPTCAGRGAAAPPAGAVPPRPAAAAPRPGAASSPPGGRTPRRDSAQRRPPRSSLAPGRLHPTQKVAGRDVFGARRAGPRTRGGDDGDLRSPQPAAAPAAGSPCGFLQTPVRRISEARRRAGGGRPGL